MKARRAFFHYWSIGVIQGEISPISSRTILETCVMPILLYGSENWIMTDQGLVDRLEAFQGELAKRVLRWPKHHSNTAAITCREKAPVIAEVAGRISWARLHVGCGAGLWRESSRDCRT